MSPQHRNAKFNHPLASRSPGARQKKSSRTVQHKDPAEGLSITHPNAAAIDVGGDQHWVALPPGRAERTVRTFGCFTSQLEALVEWLLEHRIDTVVMESTG